MQTPLNRHYLAIITVTLHNKAVSTGHGNTSLHFKKLKNDLQNRTNHMVKIPEDLN